MTIKRLIGTDPDQIPRNSDLGSMAFQDAAGVTVGKLKVNTSATLLGSITGVAAGVYPLNISDGNAVSAGLVSKDWIVLSAQNTDPGFSGTVAGTGRTVFKGTKAGGTLASPSVPTVNDHVVSVLGTLYDGSAGLATAGMTFFVDGTVSSGVAPQRIEFQTGATNSRTTRLTIGSTGTITAATPIVANDVVTINANSTSDALRITQTGNGNALLVEDSTNPDSTPFVIDASGNVGIGVVPNSALHIERDASVSLQINRNTTDAAAPNLIFTKRRGTSASPIVVNSGDVLANFECRGYDGTSSIAGAQILAVVDGTPGVNDMPGRLVFSTTADGASSLTERMRITSTGRIGVNNTAPGAYINAGGNFVSTNGTSAQGISSNGTATDATTTALYGYATFLNPGSGVALSNLYHYDAAQRAFVGTATNQYGFSVSGTLTGATNNYGFYSNIASGTGRWNFYANGDAQNYFAGNTGIGGLPSGTYKLEVTGDAYISGNLTVNGTTTTINSTVVTIDDPIFTIGGDTAPASDDNKDRGIEFRWHNGTAAKVGFFGYDDSASAFTFIPDATNASEVFSGTAGNVVFGAITGNNNLTIGTNKLFVDTTNSRVGVNTTSPSVPLHVSTTSGATGAQTVALIGTATGSVVGYSARIHIGATTDTSRGCYIEGINTGGANNAHALVFATNSSASTPVEQVRIDQFGNVGVGTGATVSAKLHVVGDIVFKECRLDTGTTDITTTTQTTIAFFPSANIRTAEFLVQVTDVTNSQYHATKILVIHDGTNVNLVQYGVVHTANELGTFDADISGGNLRLRFTATAATTKKVKVVQTMIAA